LQKDTDTSWGGSATIFYNPAIPLRNSYNLVFPFLPHKLFNSFFA